MIIQRLHSLADQLGRMKDPYDPKVVAVHAAISEIVSLNKKNDKLEKDILIASGKAS